MELRTARENEQVVQVEVNQKLFVLFQTLHPAELAYHATLT